MKIHLIAIGGAVMHNLAIALSKGGDEVSGSDDEIFEPSRSRLQQYGLLPPVPGWFPEKITSELDAVILGMHARGDNPELLRALELNIPVYSFPEFVYEKSKSKLRIAICGSHGKTTITSMVMHALKANGKQFDYLVGAQLEGFDTMVKFSDAPMIIIEGDEYFASPLDTKPKFLHYHSQITLISGIAWDHFNVFPHFENYVDQFRALISQLTKDDILISNAGDELLQFIIAKGSTAYHITYGTPAYSISQHHPQLIFDGERYVFEIFGRHNMENLEAARSICEQIGLSRDAFYSSMQTFRGAAKRLEPILLSNDRAVFRDFAHAPSKVKASVNAVKEQFPDQTLIACLELHTYSSLNIDFLPQYAGVLKAADIKIVYVNPHALELKKLPPLTPGQIKNAFDDPSLEIVFDSDELRQQLLSLNKVKTTLLLMSSGDFNGLQLNEFA